MKIFEFTDYREFIKAILPQQRLTLTAISKAAGVNISYLSQVMGEMQNLSSDQLFLVGKFLHLDEEEVEFLLLLGDWDRSQNVKRKERLRKKILAKQTQKLKVADYVPFDAVESKSSPLDVLLRDSLAPVVDAFMTQEIYLQKPELLTEKLNISNSRLSQVIQILVDSRIIEKNGDCFQRSKGFYFAYKINASAKANAVYSRLKVVESILNPEKEDDLVSTLVFSANDEFINDAWARILAFAKEHFHPYAAGNQAQVFFANTDLITVVDGGRNA